VVREMPALVDRRSRLQRLRARSGHHATPVHDDRDGDLPPGDQRQ
jgi:hypothetical protein